LETEDDDDDDGGTSTSTGGSSSFVGGSRGGLYQIRQISKPRRRFAGYEDSPLDIFDLSTPLIEKQVLGLMLNKEEDAADGSIQVISN
jgi:hypothetical protein